MSHFLQRLTKIPRLLYKSSMKRLMYVAVHHYQTSMHGNVYLQVKVETSEWKVTKLQSELESTAKQLHKTHAIIQVQCQCSPGFRPSIYGLILHPFLH